VKSGLEVKHEIPGKQAGLQVAHLQDQHLPLLLDALDFRLEQNQMDQW